MKLELTTDLVPKMTLEAFPEPGVPFKQWKPADGPNYLVYDTSRKSPTGFAIRVGKKASVYLVEKQVAGKNMKIHVGLARGRKGDEQVIDLDTARDKARELVATAKKHGANPKDIGERIEAAELTLAQVWNQYIADLTGRSKPIKPNSLDSLKKGRAKFKDWEDRKVRLITAQEILDRFDLHAVTNKHRTAAEAMGRWATAAVGNAIENEVHNAHAEGRTPSLAYNPFTILKTKQKYRDHNQLERDYKAKGVRNPLSFTGTVGPFVKAAWAYREQNPVAADFFLLDLLWGLRGDECRSTKWRDQISDADAVTARWVDMDAKVVRINDAKNRGDHEFPIGPYAYELLKLRRESQLEGEQWVFPAKSPNSMKGYYSDPTVAMQTVRQNAGIKVVRGHDLRRTFGAACEKLGLSDRQIKRMLGHGVAGGETLGRYTTPEWEDLAHRMQKIEEEILKVAPSVYNALRPRGTQRMAVETQYLQSNPVGEAATAKRSKTGGRVKKPIEQLMAEARIRDELAGMKDDTTLPEELAAIYLCVSVAELAGQRSTVKGKKAAGSKSDANPAKAPKIKMIKPIREGAVGQNQKVFYKLGHLREYQGSITVESSFDAAVKAGIYGFVSIHAPFFAQPEKRSDRGRAVLIGKAWDKTDPQWAKRFKDLIDGNLRPLWLTPAEAAASSWSSPSAHKAFAKPWLANLKGESQAVRSAIEGTEISEVIFEKPAKRLPLDRRV